MRTFPGCYDCILRQATWVVNSSDFDREIQIQTLRRVLKILAEVDDGLCPAAIAGITNQAMRDSLGIEDFYQEEKETSHQLALSYIEDLRNLAKEGIDPLVQGLKISAAGNIIDIIYDNDYDLWNEVVTSVGDEILGGGIPAFRERLSESTHLLYLADNVGETVFDRVLIENLDIPVIYAVKGGPILNDATLDDALNAGIDQVAEIVVTGSQSPGTVLEECTDDFLALFESSPLVLSKGQANYETLEEEGDKVFFLMRVKCHILSKQLHAPIGSLVMKQGSAIFT
jgi:uncharacterized protein with ATP-grasp and redox domains